MIGALLENIKQVKARSKVNNALRDGKIRRPVNCSKCRRPLKLQAHHTDYDDPLNVDWLCASCHKKVQDLKYKRT